MKIFYTAFFLVILLCVMGCDDNSCGGHLVNLTLDTTYTCIDGIAYKITYDIVGNRDSEVLLPFSQEAKSTCGNGPKSPASANSAKGVAGTGGQASPGSQSSRFQRSSTESRPAAQGMEMYFPQRVLALPFFAPPSPNDALARRPACTATDPDVVQVSHLTGQVFRISTCSGARPTAIPVRSRPLQVEITPDGRTALVTSFDNAVNFIDLASNRVTYTLQTDATINPNGIAITPDGSFAYITSFNTVQPAVQVIDLTSRTVVATIPVTSYPQSAFVTPDGSQVWITFPLGGAIYVIDTLTNTVANTIGVPSPYGIAFNSTGTKAYVTSWSGSPGSVQVIDTSTYRVTKTYAVGTGPVDIAVAYGDRDVLVNNYTSGSVSRIDTATDKVTTADVGGSPVGLALLP